MSETGKPLVKPPSIPALLTYLGGLAKPAPRIFSFVRSEKARAGKDNGSGPPAARLTPGLVALATLDELIVAVMKTPGRVPSADRLDDAIRELMTAHALYERRGWLADPTSFHRTPPPAERPGIRRIRIPSIGFEQLTFPSEYKPDPEDPGLDRWLGHESNNTVHAWMLRHRDGKDRPWMLCLHAFAMGYAPVDMWALRAKWFHRELGFNVVFPVAPMHGPRRIGYMSGAGFMTYNLIDSVHGFTQSVWDIRRLMGWIRAQGAERIAVYGASMGGHIAGVLAGLEPDLACVLPAFPTTDLVDLMRQHGPAHLREHADEHPLAGRFAEEVQRVVMPLALPPVVPTDRLAIIAGLADRMAGPAQAHRLWEHWDRPRVAWLNANHLAFMWSGEVTGFIRKALKENDLL
jgi:pimeloyl-ACP methyl ester carboxylesterase